MNGLLVITVIYIAAGVAAVAVYGYLAQEHLLLRLLLADIAATCFVFTAGSVLKNATVYDPYWSIAPLIILISLMIESKLFTSAHWLLLAAVCFWGLRLTINWAMTFQNLSTQDWRYDMLRNKFPRIYPLISFAGIHMFPTLVVFTALVPALYFIRQPAVNALTVAGFLLCLAATFLQWTADIQMHRFRKTRQRNNELIRSGLWQYARHPNYLGEILFWWGIFVFLLSVNPGLWYLGLGALVNTVMFFMISIPMIEKRLAASKPGFAEYKAKTRMLIPLP